MKLQYLLYPVDAAYEVFVAASSDQAIIAADSKIGECIVGIETNYLELLMAAGYKDDGLLPIRSLVEEHTADVYDVVCDLRVLLEGAAYTDSPLQASVAEFFAALERFSAVIQHFGDQIAWAEVLELGDVVKKEEGSHIFRVLEWADIAVCGGEEVRYFAVIRYGTRSIVYFRLTPGETPDPDSYTLISDAREEAQVGAAFAIIFASVAKKQQLRRRCHGGGWW